ncbi:protein REVEILLE 7-like isoform X2 [Pistacia vera]|uniref:protein REVEILLE 7-like isoform X2 n=1 Tax=Pistacia vera TaxID=55513 RepID=UPI001262B66B|nr:protein REVEILLE 7-like isoform X2 [Pistacia vera]
MGGVGVKLKVVRESNGGAESSIKPIEIPPPRPKRKPMHPYPRKSTDLLQGTPVSNQPERSPSTNVSVLDKDNQSPTSVLSPFASDTLGSAVSDQQNGCSSPTSCTTEMQSTNVLTAEKENEYVTSNSSPEEEKVSISSACPNRGDFLSVKIEPHSKESVYIKGDAVLAPPCATIKLFGKTVLVTGSHKPYPSDTECYESPITKSSQENLNIDNVNSINLFSSKKLETHLSLGMVSGNLKPSASEAPCMETQKENGIAESSPNASLPCWPTMYQGLPFFYVMSDNQNSVAALVESNVKDMEKEMLHERSCTGSSTGSVSELENRERNSDAAVDSHCRQSCSPVQASPCNSRKGFVPYKRCFLEEDMKSSIVVSEERERQRARVCS